MSKHWQRKMGCLGVLCYAVLCCVGTCQPHKFLPRLQSHQHHCEQGLVTRERLCFGQKHGAKPGMWDRAGEV